MLNIVYFTIVIILMNKKLKITKHAITRFNERIIPFLNKKEKSFFTNISNLIQYLSSHLDLEKNNIKKNKYFIPFFREKKPPINLILIINPSESIIITLWTTGVNRKNSVKK